MIIFNKEFPTQINGINDIINSVMSEIYLIPDKLVMPRQSLRLILDEAITNAMEHGNRWNPEKKISVNIKKTENCINVTISDEGDGFQFSKKLFQVMPSPLNERGRGIHLIRFICSAEWQNNGSTVNLLIPIECTV